MKVYGCPNTRSVRVVWMLEELGLDYEYERVDLGSGAARRPPYLAVNPGGKVPALVDGDLVMTESAAIVTWLGTRHPQAGLVPEPGGASHARYLQWLLFLTTELEQGLWTVAKHTFALPEARRVAAVRDTARWEYGVAATLLEQGLGAGPYLLGDAFSAVDIVAAHILSWARKAAPGVSPAALEAYADRLLARPALARAREREAGTAG